MKDGSKGAKSSTDTKKVTNSKQNTDKSAKPGKNSKPALSQEESRNRRKRLLIGITVAVIVLVLGVGAYFGVRFMNFCLRMNEIKSVLNSVKNSDNIKFTADVTYGARKLDIAGDFEKAPDGTYTTCGVNYGDRTATLYINTSDSNAYIYIETETEEQYIKTGINALRYALGDREAEIGWEELLKSDEASPDLNQYYDSEELDKVADKLIKKLQSPFALYGMMTCKKTDGVYTLEVDMYKLIMTAVECAKPAFKTEGAYDSLVATVNAEKEALKKEPLSIKLSEKGDSTTQILIKLTGASTVSADMSLNMGGADVGEFSIDKDKCEKVRFDVAAVRILRAGLDTKAALNEAYACLDAFEQRFSYTIIQGTMVVMTDSNGNMFQFAYGADDKLVPAEYGDDMYGIWQNGGYIDLNTENLDSGEYTVRIYEPASGKGSEDSEGYNNAYLAALQAYSAITGAGYAMTEDAIFLVTENDVEYQFVYQDGNLYDVYEQYYYVLYERFVQADMTGVNGIPENVTLYIPNNSDK